MRAALRDRRLREIGERLEILGRLGRRVQDLKRDEAGEEIPVERRLARDRERRGLERVSRLGLVLAQHVAGEDGALVPEIGALGGLRRLLRGRAVLFPELKRLIEIVLLLEPGRRGEEDARIAPRGGGQRGIGAPGIRPSAQEPEPGRRRLLIGGREKLQLPGGCPKVGRDEMRETLPLIRLGQRIPPLRPYLSLPGRRKITADPGPPCIARGGGAIAARLLGVRAAQQRLGRGRRILRAQLAHRRIVRLGPQRGIEPLAQLVLERPIGIVLEEGRNLGRRGGAGIEQAIEGDELAGHRVRILGGRGGRLVPLVRPDERHRVLRRRRTDGQKKKRQDQDREANAKAHRSQYYPTGALRRIPHAPRFPAALFPRRLRGASCSRVRSSL